MTAHDFKGTRIDEISDSIFRISTAVPSIAGGGITFNQYLLVDDEPLLLHTGKRRMFPQVREAVTRVLPLSNACDGSLSPISRLTSAVPLMSSSPSLRMQSHCAATFLRCCP